MSLLTLVQQALAYDDVAATSNPTQLRVNRRPSVSNVPVENAGTVPVTLAPGDVTTVVDGTRTLTLDGTTAFSLSLSPLDPTRYRVAWTGGTNPGFRTDRGLDLHTIVLTLTALSNLSLTVVAGTGTPFAAVQVGDTAFIPGVTTGDPAGPFNPLNEGYWSVLSVGGSGASVTMARAPGSIFSGYSEVVTPSVATQFQAFSATGVQVGDTLDLSAGFAAPALHSYEIVAITSKWVEFQSTAPLGAQTGILPGATGLVVYTSAKRWVMVETDQELCARVNGDTTNHVKVQPWVPGDPAFVGSFSVVGPVWKLVLVSLSTAPATVVVSSAE